MSFTRPTLSEIVTRVQVDFVSRLELVGAILRRAMIYVLSRVIAGAAHMLHGHLDYLARQLFADLADGPYLVRFAGLFGIVKTPPTFALRPAGITGVDLSVVPEGTVLVRSDGALYETVFLGEYDLDSATIAAGIGAVMLQSQIAGSDYNLIEGDVLTFQSPIAGVDATATVEEEGIDGTDEETTEALRVRFLERLQDPPHGGNDADYVAWGKEVPGVTRVWVTRLGLGPGTVVVRFMRDNDASTPYPDSGEVADVQLKMDEEAPVHATVTVIGPTEVAQVFTIAVTPDTTEVREAVEAELVDLFLREGEPGGTVLLSAIRTAIGTAAGIEDYTLTVPAGNVTAAANELLSVGAITWS